MPTPSEKAKLRRMAHQNDYIAWDTTAKALPTCGCVHVAGGTGLTATLAAPQPGDRLRVVVDSLTSGALVITTAAGVTFDGTNNTATLNAAAEEIELVYGSATSWKVERNIGSVGLSSV